MVTGVKETASSAIVVIENQKISGSSAVAHVKVMLLLLLVLWPLVVLLTLKCMHIAGVILMHPFATTHLSQFKKYCGDQRKKRVSRSLVIGFRC